MTTVQSHPAAPPGHGPEALIKEARARQRRRRRTAAAAVVLAAAAGAGAFAAFGGGVSHPPPAAPPPAAASPAAASPGAIRAFLARAQQGSGGTFALTYLVTIAAAGHAPARQAEVTAAQRSQAEWRYRETPSFSPFSRGHSLEVVTSAAGIFSCAQPSTHAPWSCRGPDTGTGMGTTGQLLGPYPPQALVRGLQNAAETYTGAPSHSPRAATRPEPAYLLTRRIAGQADRCLAFGPVTRPLGSVCLARGGVIAYYNLTPTVTDSAYQTAILRAYSRHLASRALALPARPARSP
jgi:hypothetical protein